MVTYSVNMCLCVYMCVFLCLSVCLCMYMCTMCICATSTLYTVHYVKYVGQLFVECVNLYE